MILSIKHTCLGISFNDQTYNTVCIVPTKCLRSPVPIVPASKYLLLSYHPVAFCQDANSLGLHFSQGIDAPFWHLLHPLQCQSLQSLHSLHIRQCQVNPCSLWTIEVVVHLTRRSNSIGQVSNFISCYFSAIQNIIRIFDLLSNKVLKAQHLELLHPQTRYLRYVSICIKSVPNRFRPSLIVVWSTSFTRDIHSEVMILRI